MCRYAECCYAECRGALQKPFPTRIDSTGNPPIQQVKLMGLQCYLCNTITTSEAAEAMVFAFCLYVQLAIIEADMLKSSSTLIY